jgi:hypothetical protein
MYLCKIQGLDFFISGSQANILVTKKHKNYKGPGYLENLERWTSPTSQKKRILTTQSWAVACGSG